MISFQQKIEVINLATQFPNEWNNTTDNVGNMISESVKQPRTSAVNSKIHVKRGLLCRSLLLTSDRNFTAVLQHGCELQNFRFNIKQCIYFHQIEDGKNRPRLNKSHFKIKRFIYIWMCIFDTKIGMRIAELPQRCCKTIDTC